MSIRVDPTVLNANRQHHPHPGHKETETTVGEKSIEHSTIFLNKYISRGSIDMTFSPDESMQSTQTKISNYRCPEIRL